MNQKTTFNIEEMFQREIYFCEFFTNKVSKDYGLIFHNIENPQSYDSNHAHIFKLDHHVNSAIQDIVEFYQSLNLTPRLYPSFIEHELDVLRPSLETYGFKVETHENTWMLFNKNYSPIIDFDVSFQKITQVSQDIIDLIHTDDEGDWMINLLKRHVHDEHFHLLGLYDNNKCVSIASVKIMDGYSRIDDVKTHTAFRGQHFGTKLINYLVAYHQEISDNHLYLFAYNPIAIRLYKNVGFQEVPIQKTFWSAYKKSD